MLIRCVIIWAVICLSMATHANVLININGSNYSYNENPRLEQVLAPIALQSNWYWPSAQLFDLDDANIELKRDELIQLIKQDAAANVEFANDYQILIEQIQTWTLADRVNIDIDFDLARFSIEHNPKFENGRYLLTVSTRPERVYIFGAVKEAGYRDFSENTCVTNVLAKIERLDSADTNSLYLISPNGNVEKAPIAYWNRACVVPMPGSLIYVPIQESSWSADMAQMNKMVTSLALNKVQVP